MTYPEQRDLEQRLREDAGTIDAEVSPQLQQRIAASIHSTKQLRSVSSPQRHKSSYWWASSLTGVTAALLIILLINQDREAGRQPDESSDMVTTTTPEVMEMYRPFPLSARTADLTEPLEEELQHLQSDLEKARESVVRDLRSAL
jgi:hypothetical protein